MPDNLFTIGFVNYKSSVYLETQLKMYQQFAGESFEIIIVDTSWSTKEFDRVKSIVEKFPSLSIRASVYEPKGEYGTESHGEGLQHVYEMVDTKYFIAQDPDFFWVKPQFLSYLKEKLQDHMAVGAPYSKGHALIKMGHPNFPAAFGAAYRTKVLRAENVTFVGSRRKLPSGEQMDVGWHVRHRLARIPDERYCFFDHVHFSPPARPVTYEFLSRRYFDGDETIAYHFQRGSFETNGNRGLFSAAKRGPRRRDDRWGRKEAPIKWQENRKKACEFFWEEINGAAQH